MNNQRYTVEDLFLLGVTQKRTSTLITMRLLSKQLTTSEIPFTDELLKQHLPNVLRTQCYNDDNLPFAIEVRNTEIGHLFEHVLLEYLCQLKIAKGATQAEYSGRTNWNWIRNPLGTFSIRLSCGMKDADIFPLALEKTITLMKIVMQHKQEALFTPPLQTSRNGQKNGKRLRKNNSSKVIGR